MAHIQVYTKATVPKKLYSECGFYTSHSYTQTNTGKKVDQNIFMVYLKMVFGVLVLSLLAAGCDLFNNKPEIDAGKALYEIPP
jgi:hypothetical protein